jgi:hypothetical protein
MIIRFVKKWNTGNGENVSGGETMNLIIVMGT